LSSINFSFSRVKKWDYVFIGKEKILLRPKNMRVLAIITHPEAIEGFSILDYLDL
jgi:hypothetical protein